MNPITNSIAAVTRLFGAFDAAIHRDGLNSVMYVSRFSAGLGKQLAAFDLAVRYLWPATGQPGGQPQASPVASRTDLIHQQEQTLGGSGHMHMQLRITEPAHTSGTLWVALRCIWPAASKTSLSPVQQWPTLVCSWPSDELD